MNGFSILQMFVMVGAGTILGYFLCLILNKKANQHMIEKNRNYKEIMQQINDLTKCFEQKKQSTYFNLLNQIRGLSHSSLHYLMKDE